MLLEIRHKTVYTYSRAVFLEPHVFRLQPRCDGRQHVNRFVATITPEPAGCSPGFDAEGNAVLHAWFDGITDSLAVQISAHVETRCENPFDYLPEAITTSLPIMYPDDLKDALARYLPTAVAEPSLVDYARGVVDEVDAQTIPFLALLSQRLSEDCTPIIREEGDPLPAALTLRDRSGSCRDLAVLFMECCRLVGIAARFVSGYQEAEPKEGKRYLHAWTEVYLPGGGWRGYDPMQGIAVADRHVAVSTGPTPRSAAPTVGTFRGSGVTASMEAELEIDQASP